MKLLTGNKLNSLILARVCDEARGRTHVLVAAIFPATRPLIGQCGTNRLSITVMVRAAI